MSNGKYQPTKSNGNFRSGSFQNGTGSKRDDRTYQRAPSLNDISEIDDNEYDEAPYDDDAEQEKIVEPPRDEDPYIAALRYRFPSRPKTDYSYSKPNIPINTSGPPPAPPLPKSNSTSTGRYESTSRQNPTRQFPGRETNDGNNFRNPQLRKVKDEEKNTYSRNLINSPTQKQTSVPPRSDYQTSNLSNTQKNQPYRSNMRGEEPTDQPSPTSWQYKKCVQECLEREKNRNAGLSQTGPPQNSSNIKDREGYLPEQRSRRASLQPTQTNKLITRVSPILDLNDIRHINVALSRSGIPLFPCEHFRPYDIHSSPSIIVERTVDPLHYPIPIRRSHVSGAVVSACRIADEEA